MLFMRSRLQKGLRCLIMAMLLAGCAAEVAYLEKDEVNSETVEEKAVVIWHTRIIDHTRSRDGHFPYYNVTATEDMHTGGFQRLYHQDKSSPDLAARVVDGWVPREGDNYFDEIIVTLLEPGSYSVDGLGLAVGPTAAGSFFSIFKSYDFAAGRLYHLGVYNLELKTRDGDAYNYRFDVFQNPSIVERDMEKFQARFPEVYNALKDKVSTVY